MSEDSFGMHIKRSVSKLVRAVSQSPMLARLKYHLEKTPIIHQGLEKLPSLSLILFSVYLGCGLSSIFIDIFFSLLAFIMVGVLLYNVQDRLLYHPGEPITARVYSPSPNTYADMNYESITVKTQDGTLIHGFFIKHEKYNEKPTIIVYHGNAGNIGYRVANAYHLVNECGTNVLLMEYRGYGLSGGEISEQGLYDDAISVVRYVKHRKDIDSSRIVVYGRSLGGAVAVDVAAHPECTDLLAVILENTFTTLPDIAKRVLNFSVIKAIPSWCYKNKYPTLEKIANVRQPTLFLSGRSDTLIPPRHMDVLYSASGAIQKRMSSFPEGTHNETWTQPGYFFAIHNFLQNL